MGLYFPSNFKGFQPLCPQTVFLCPPILVNCNHKYTKPTTLSYYFFFPTCVSFWVVSIITYSSLLILSFATSNLLLALLSVFFLSGIIASIPTSSIWLFKKCIFHISSKHEGGAAKCVTYNRGKPNAQGGTGYTASPKRNLFADRSDFYWDLSAVEIITPWPMGDVSSHVTVFLKLHN